MSRRARQRALARPWAQGEAPEEPDDNDFDSEWPNEADFNQQPQGNQKGTHASDLQTTPR